MIRSNFIFIEKYQPEFARLCSQAEGYVYSDPQSAVVKLRCFAEKYVGFIYRELSISSDGTKNLFELIDNAAFQNAVEDCVVDKLHLIRMKGNRAAHNSVASVEDALSLVKESFFLCVWVYMTYYDGLTQPFPKYQAPEAKPIAENRFQQDLLQAKAELEAAQKEHSQLRQRIEKSEAELNEAKQSQIKDAGQRAVATYDFEPVATLNAIRMIDVFSEYQLTDGQAKLVSELEEFLSNRDSDAFILKGYAGTGKTFITKGLTEYFKIVRRNFVLAAPTGKASKVIANKTQCEAYTIHKTIYSFKDVKEYTEDLLDGSETYKFYADLAVNSLSVDTVYIVDESSMISDVYSENEFFRCGSGHLLKDFLKFVNLDHNDHRKKVIFIGDDAQLPPVGMKASPALDPSYLAAEYGVLSSSYELTEVVRQKADSGVLHNAIAIRMALKDGVFNKLDFDLNFPDVEHIVHENVISQYLDSCQHQINGESIIVASSNNDVAAFNRRIREEFFPGIVDVCANDKLMAVTNSDAYGFFISNGDFGRVREVSPKTESRTITLRRKSKETGKMEETEVVLRFRYLNVGFRDLEGKPRWFNAYIIENLLYSDKPALSSDESKAMYLDFCIRHKSLKPNTVEFKNALRVDPYFNALRVKFGYAITCHKAQGSEWNNVFVKCSTYQSQLSADYFRWLYTAITRTSNKLYLLDPPRIKLGAGIKVVGNPGLIHSVSPSDTKRLSGDAEPMFSKTIAVDTQALSLNTPDETFGIPLENGFLISLLTQVKSLACGADICIDELDHKQYQEVYFFSRGPNSARVNIIYNGKQKITSLSLPELSPLGSELLSLLAPLKGRVITALVSGEPALEFGEPFLKEFYELLKTKACEHDIDIPRVEDRQYSQRYWFHQLGDDAVVDIYYNAKKQFTTCNPLNNLSSSTILLNQAVDIIKNGLS